MIDEDKRQLMDDQDKKNLMGVMSVIILFMFTCFFVNINNKEVLACANSRSTMLEGKTVTNVVLNYSKEINKGPSKSYSKVVHITIDDGPSQYTDEIVKILDDNDVKATFFMIDSNMKAYPQQVKNIINSGNTPGLHSVTHDIHKLYSSKKAARKEFDVNNQTLKEITGQTSNVVRLPFGSKPYTPRASYEEIINSGYNLWDWTLDTEDWKSNSSQILKSVKDNVGNYNDIILLIHEKPQSVEVLDEIIKIFKDEGFNILPINQNEKGRNYWDGI